MPKNILKEVNRCRTRFKQRFEEVKVSNVRYNEKCNFLGIGVMKGGTTALDAFMRNHPQLQMPYQKEISLFDAKYYDLVKGFAGNVHSIYFPKPEEGRIRGEVTPNYCFKPKALENIYNYNPEAKLILLLRNPYLRCFSHWNMRKQKGVKHGTFIEALENEDLFIREPEKRRFLIEYIARSLYVPQIQSILELFDKEQLLIVNSEELLNEPNGALNKVTEFLGLDPFENVTPKLVHKRDYDSVITPDCYEIMEKHFESDLDELGKYVSWSLDEWRSPRLAE